MYQTFSDTQLDKRIGYMRKAVAKVKAGWTKDRLQADLSHLLAQRQLPREQRTKWYRGAI